MSLILEALRKSEAERRRAQVPDLLSQPQAVEAIARAPASRWPVWIGIAVLALIAAWFVLHRAPAKVEDDGTDATIVQAPAIATPAPIATNPAPAARPAPALQRPLVVAPRVAAPVPASPATHAVAITTDIPASLPPPAPAPTPIAHDTTERITDLGPDERKALPPLKLSMHMWNDVTAQRFVIIDGTRLVVGDHIGPLVVSDIVPDGVLLDWNGRALKLPLR